MSVWADAINNTRPKSLDYSSIISRIMSYLICCNSTVNHLSCWECFTVPFKLLILCFLCVREWVLYAWMCYVSSPSNQCFGSFELYNFRSSLIFQSGIQTLKMTSYQGNFKTLSDKKSTDKSFRQPKEVLFYLK